VKPWFGVRDSCFVRRRILKSLEVGKRLEGQVSESSSQQPIRDYKDLHVWQKGMQLAKGIYLLTSRFPLGREVWFGLPDVPRSGFHSIQYC
jgi:hypothetical protein